MKKRIICILMIIILINAAVYIVFADTPSDYKKQIENAQSQSDDAKKQLEEVNGEINNTLQEIEDLNSSISSLEEELNTLTKELEELNSYINEKQKDLDEKQALLDERLSVAYMNGNNTYAEAFFSGGLINFISNYDMIKQIAEYDTELIQEVKNAKQELENEKIKIENVKIEKEAKNAEFQKLKQEKEEKVNNLTDEQKQIQTQIEEYDNQMKILMKKEIILASKENSGNNTTISSGTFQWPVPSSSRITSNYGYRVHPISGTWKLHAGLDIGAEGGADIVAGESGTVLLASFGYNGGYGNYVIINHGNGITTRYAHCSNLYVSTGDTVIKGQVIAAVGSTGASTGNHCHFEVRINGESKDPKNYL